MNVGVEAGETAPRGILVVDDDSRNRELLAEFLAPICTVFQAGDGGQALELVAREHPDVVLLDVMMPGRNGFEVCREIKFRTRHEYLPVLLLTALCDQEHRNRGLAAGADDFLNKPVDRRELMLRVSSFLRLSAQERVIRAQLARLTRLERLKEDLISLIVHDVRTPLQGVLHGISLIERKLGAAREGPLAGHLAQTLLSANRVRELVTDMLDIRLIEEQGLVPSREEVRVGELLQQVRADVGPLAERVKVEVEVRAGEELRWRLDSKLVRRAVENVVANGLRYAPAGSQVTVEAAPGEELVIRVADAGCGVPDDFKQTIFEKFGSVEAQRGTERRGHGLGLYFVKLVMEAHRGRVRVRDGEAGGALFELSFPS